ncbi:alpha-galactosidase [candidate division KSB1 bacterium]|nr:alpha-galactosidase [candidate division KSB1 bacterium]
MKPCKNNTLGLIASVLVTFLLPQACDSQKDYAVKVDGKNLQLLFNQNLHGRVVAKLGSLPIEIGDYSPCDFIVVAGTTQRDFSFKESKKETIDDAIGKGQKHTLVGNSAALRKEIFISLYDDFPSLAVFQVSYTNIGETELTVESWTNNHYAISANGKTDPHFWSYQSGSYESRADWVLPLKAGFTQDNFMGMNASDYGGGTPVVDIWRRDIGIGVGHLEMTPKLVSLPVTMPDSATAHLGVQYNRTQTLKPNESLTTFQTFVAVHQGDYFQTLAAYRRMMMKKGIAFADPPTTTYEPEWCAWGYERNFTMEQVINTLPMAKKLGYQWATLDDGWQTAEGDWYLDKKKFPNGDADMIAFVKRINAQGLKSKLWWSPLAVDPGTDLIKHHPEYLLLNADGSKQNISWWDAYYLCPAYPPVQEYTKNLVTTFMKTWGFHGLKIDGQHLNGAPPCYNPAHQHAYPEEAVEKTPEFFKAIYETAMSIHSDAVVQICPCGTAFSFFTMPYMNQSVSSDPESSWQIRLKGKTLKALMGPNAAYYGDHVELSDDHDDFASTVGIGGIVGTKFTWPVGAKKDSKVDLTPEREVVWAKWAHVYHDKMLPAGRYRGELYDIGFDKPEAHAIQKEGKRFYAFYADEWNGEVELRGLESRSYRVQDYVNQKDYGLVQGPTAKLVVQFNRNLLLEAVPE